MSISFNNITLAGNLGRDPDLKYTPNGKAICTFSIAVNESKKDSNGEWQNKALWFKVRAWGNQGEACSNKLFKGSPCIVNGRLSVEEWKDQNQNNRYALVIDANNITFLDKSGGDQSGSQNRPPASTAPSAPTEPEISDEDIPF